MPTNQILKVFLLPLVHAPTTIGTYRAVADNRPISKLPTYPPLVITKVAGLLVFYVVFHSL